MNYQNGKIYKIVDNTNGNIYIGSTCMPTLAKRLAQHRSDYNKWKKGKYSYVTSFKILENNNYDIILLESFPSNSIDELRARERFYIENKECVNRNIPNRSLKEYNAEYYKQNKEQIIEYYKEYREQNKEQIKGQKQKYYEDNKEQIKAQQAEYYEQNKEQIKERIEAYREQNRDKIIEKKNKKFTCECGGQYTCANKSQHLKSKKHQKYINDSENK